MMDLFLKSAACALIATILGLILSKHSKESSVLICIIACCIIATAVTTYLQPTFEFIDKLQRMSSMNSDILEILVKSTGIAILSEMVSTICTDAGNAALGKTLQLLATAVILCLSIPLLNTLIELIEKILVSI